MMDPGSYREATGIRLPTPLTENERLQDVTYQPVKQDS